MLKKIIFSNNVNNINRIKILKKFFPIEIIYIIYDHLLKLNFKEILKDIIKSREINIHYDNYTNSIKHCHNYIHSIWRFPFSHDGYSKRVTNFLLQIKE